MSSPSASRLETAVPQAGNRRLMIVLCAAAVFLYWSSLYLYMPTLSTYVESKTNNLAMVGSVLAQYGLWQAIIRLPLGIVSDWVGRRKPFIIGGFLLSALGAWLLAATNHVNGLLIGRAITGLAAGTWVPLVVLFSSLFPPAEAVRASALLTLVGSVGRMLSTGVTGSLNDLGGYSLAFFLAVAAAGIAILVILPSKEQLRPPKRPSPKSLVTLITRRDVLLPAILSAVAQYANWATTFGFFPNLADRLGATDVIQGLLMSLNIGFLTVGNLMATTIVNRLGARRMVYLSFILIAAGTIGAALAPSLPFLFVAQFCIGIAMGVGSPVLMGMSIRYVDESERSSAMGLHQSVYAIGMFAGPALSGPLADLVGIRAMFGITGIACLAVGLLVTRWLEPKAQQAG